MRFLSWAIYVLLAYFTFAYAWFLVVSWKEVKPTLSASPPAVRRASFRLHIWLLGMWLCFDAIAFAATQMALTIGEVFPKQEHIIFGMIVVIVFSGLLFALKVHNLIVYAIAEGLFALIYAGTNIYHMGSSISLVEIAVLGSSIYLLIRAMDNFRNGWKLRKGRLALATATTNAAQANV